MAQNVGTPRFYVSIFQWLDAMGLMEYNATSYLTGKTAKELVHINPTSQGRINVGSSVDTTPAIEFIMHYNTYKKMMPNDKNFTMLLGHNFSKYSQSHSQHFWAAFSAKFAPNGDYGANYIGGSNSSSYVNHNHGIFSHDGFSIAHANDAQDVDSAYIRISFQSFEANYDYKIGSILYGTYYDMPHSPDLSLKMSVEMDGVKNIQTKGGATLSNASYTKPPNWGDSGAWQLGNIENFRHGRRSWDLSFSYLSDTDIMAKVAASSSVGSGIEFDYSDNDAQLHTLRTESDFFSLVWNRTMGGHLPFVFQPNGDNNSPDQFAICRFDMNSLQYEQVANNVYNVKLKIRECW